MDWDDVDAGLLEHFRKLGKIRRDNRVIGSGRQRTIDTHTCLRYDDTDKLLIRLRPQEGRPIEVAGIFPDGTVLTELYTGTTAEVREGKVEFPAYGGGVAVIR